MKAPFVAIALSALPSSAMTRDFPEIERQGVVRIVAVSITGGDDELWSDNPQLPGLEREVLERFCSAHQLRMQLVLAKSWSDLVPTLLEGKGDIIAGRFTITPKRRQEIAFTVPVFPTRLALVTFGPQPAMTSLEQLKGQKIGTVKGTSMEETLLAAGIPAGSIDSSFAPGTLVASLKVGKAAVVALGIEQVIPEMRDPNVRLGMFVGPPGGLAWGMRKDSPVLKARLNSFLDAFLSSGEWNRLVLKYFGAKAPELLRGARGE